jgi:parallel beta-helix repeat protein
MDSGDGMLIVTPSTGGGGSVVSGNTISGSGAHGIYINAHGAPKAGGVTVSSNNITGFRTPVLIH